MIELQGNLLEGLREIEEGVRDHVVRSVAYAGAKVLYDEVRRQAPVYTGKERKGIKPGQLRDAIYHVFSESLSTDMRAMYEISWNASKAPHGHLIEYGHWIVRGKVGKGNAGPPRRVGWAPAIPFVRRSFDRAQAAVSAMEARAVEKMQEVLSRTIVDDFGNEVAVGAKHGN
ncbi:HK97 gp10 family phage protein [Cupriavidus basilensis]|uniref:HK97 gp10 family phage protein n=1 Tax=Cupriavidus basilensis TaxID=68895 RepID=UPI0039F6CBB9